MSKVRVSFEISDAYAPIKPEWVKTPVTNAVRILFPVWWDISAITVEKVKME